MCPGTLGRLLNFSASWVPHVWGSRVCNEDLLSEFTESCKYDSILQRTRHTVGAQYMSIHSLLSNVFKPPKFGVV